MRFVNLVENGVVTPQATVSTGRHNVINVSGFEVSIDAGVTYVEDESLACTVDGVIVLQNAPAIIRAKLDDITNTSGLLVQLGY